MKTDAIHIGEMIRKVVAEKNVSGAEMSRRIATTRQNVNKIYLRSSIDTSQLLSISHALDFNFFQLYSDLLSKPGVNTKSNKLHLENIKATLQIELNDEKREQILSLLFDKQ